MVIGFLFGILVGALIGLFVSYIFSSTDKAVGEMRVDAEKELLEVAYYSVDDLEATIHEKDSVTFDVVRTTLDFQIPQEKQWV